MTRFNPFAPVNCSHGAPMGRVSAPPQNLANAKRLCAKHQGGDGYYDRGGAYWGTSNEGPVWAVWESGSGLNTTVYVRALSAGQAKEKASRFASGNGD